MAINKSQVSIVRCSSYERAEVARAVKEALSLVGGIEKFIKPGSRVLLKPNLLSGRPPADAVNTHPEFLRAVGRLVKTVTPNILVGDSPGGWNLRAIADVYENAGIKQICDEEGFKAVKFDKVVDIKGLPFASVINEVDFIISLPKLKTHSVMMITGAIKNTFGMIVGMSKAHCHLKYPMPEDLAPVLVDVFGVVRPVLSIVDGITGMEGDGPAAGTVRNFNLVLAGADAVAIDSVISRLAGIDPLSVKTTAEAARRDYGTADIDKIEILGEKLEDSKIKNFRMPGTFKLYRLPKSVIRKGIKYVKFYPRISLRKCRGCGLCFAICPKKTIKKAIMGKFRVKTKDCICCLCCHEVCPYKAISLKKSLLARFMIG